MPSQFDSAHALSGGGMTPWTTPGASTPGCAASGKPESAPTPNTGRPDRPTMWQLGPRSATVGRPSLGVIRTTQISGVTLPCRGQTLTPQRPRRLTTRSA
ncbi:hypothetical protein BGW36DRAFT_383060 [Talaromyces proteolyticus]|uniref:Uncharacterized protein n=1 Tax=Talaromyces proteolyticus TaxID=1131652 RepID=A0AAD4KLX7_9EURO|nr:uncharacterized protein BGW36DRAFT_383060 [Talaromyces proteolyticus]KAH8695658.1 hypothetical protein BGW36DRAFT_383060 [Talaromyces proteolyticus]